MPSRSQDIDTDSEVAEAISRLFHLAADAEGEEQSLEALVTSAGNNFLKRKQVTPHTASELKERFSDTRMPDGHLSTREYLQHLAEEIIFPSTQMTSPMCMANMTSTLPYFTRPLGRLLLMMNQNMVKDEASRALTPYERQALGIIHRMLFKQTPAFYSEHLQNPESSLGMFVSGGTLANISALWCARNRALGPKGDFRGVETQGMAKALREHGYEGAAIIGSTLMHYSFDKGAALLGLGSDGLIGLSTDAEHRVDIAEMRAALVRCQNEKIRVLSLVGIAGTTDSGSVDPLEEIAALAEEFGVHFHVDAAWGGPLLLSEKHRGALKGIERADSVTIDGHKQFCLPIGIAALMLKDPMTAKVIERSANYIMQEGTTDLGKRALEGSRPGMALFLHAALNILGKRGYAYLVDQNMEKTQHMAASIRANPAFELLLQPKVNIVLYRYVPKALRRATANAPWTVQELATLNTVNAQLQRRQAELGDSLVSRTTIAATAGGMPARATVLRAVVLNPKTTRADVDELLRQQERIGDQG
jgi:putative pyridoxal-dependent aspartate 1-decarboxylase